MGDRIRASVQRAADAFEAAGGPLHHLTLGPGPALTAEWVAAGLDLPDLPRMRRYRFERIREQLHLSDLVGILVMDPMNIRYATDTTNMQVWVMHNGARYAWIGADGRTILWEFANCEFFAGHNPLIDEVRPAISSTYFQAGSRYAEQARRWVDELLDVAGHRPGAGGKRTGRPAPSRPVGGGEGGPPELRTPGAPHGRGPGVGLPDPEDWLEQCPLPQRIRGPRRLPRGA